MHWFSIAAVNKYHKLSALYNTNLLTSRDQKSEMDLWAKVKVSEFFFPGDFRGESSFFPFPASRRCPYSLAHSCLPSSKDSNGQANLLQILSL